ncbi:MAG: FAD-dependent oxidoreductase [Chloroflexi bacterium]|nr:FAD-dependent oxidoreductase [Chloroflexota bacterium]
MQLETELVVIGGGGAGLAAALTAAEKGVRVTVLEKRPTTGGNSTRAIGLFASESPVQHRANVVAYTDDLFKLAMNWAHWTINPRIVRAFFEKSGDTIRWLEELGLVFQCIPLYPGQNPLVWHATEGLGLEVVQVLADECKKLGVQILVRTPAKKILRGARGEVTGVLAEREGEQFEIATSCVFIGTGGYAGNKEMIRKYCSNYDENMDCIGLPHTGDGILMATEIGAATEGLGILHLGGPTVPDNIMLHLGSDSDALLLPLISVGLQPYMVWVNKKGLRFADEMGGYNHFEVSNAVARQPKATSYSLFDSRMTQMICDNGLDVVVGKNQDRQRSKLPPGFEEELGALMNKGDRVYVTDSWDAMADWIGADRATLKATVAEYNADCDRGCDPIFAKDRRFLLALRTPPYYAIRCKADFLDTIGGIKIDEHMQVLDQKDNPIPGLYAGGVDTGGWSAETYCAVLSGETFGFAINSGRIAAEHAITKFGLGS